MHVLGHLQAFSAIFWPIVGSLGTFETMFRKSWLKELSDIFCNSHFSDMWQVGAIIRHSLCCSDSIFSFFKHLLNFWLFFDFCWS